MAVQRRLGILVQMRDTLAPVVGRKGLPRRACEDTFQVNEFAVENVMMHR